MAVLAPSPSPRVRIATAVKPGVLRRRRSACRKSCQIGCMERLLVALDRTFTLLYSRLSRVTYGLTRRRRGTEHGEKTTEEAAALRRIARTALRAGCITRGRAFAAFCPCSAASAALRAIGLLPVIAPSCRSGRLTPPARDTPTIMFNAHS